MSTSKPDRTLSGDGDKDVSFDESKPDEKASEHDVRTFYRGTSDAATSLPLPLQTPRAMRRRRKRSESKIKPAPVACCKEKNRTDISNQIGFEWEPKPKLKLKRCEQIWMGMYGRLVAYKKKHGNTCVPQKWKDDPKLGHWVKRQLSSCKEEHRINLLNNIGFEWDQKGVEWMRMYGRLVAYKKMHNTTDVPLKWKEDPKLGTWVKTQRNYCKEKKRTGLLNEIGFEWQTKRRERIWMDMYGRLVAYKTKHNTTSVPLNWKEDRLLGSWVKTQRNYCTEKLRVDLLNDIGFDWCFNGDVQASCGIRKEAR